MQYTTEINSNCNLQDSQGSVDTNLRWGGESLWLCVQNFLRNLTVREVCKSVYICRSYHQKSGVLFFDSRCRIAALTYFKPVQKRFFVCQLVFVPQTEVVSIWRNCQTIYQVGALQ